MVVEKSLMAKWVVASNVFLAVSTPMCHLAASSSGDTLPFLESGSTLDACKCTVGSSSGSTSNGRVGCDLKAASTMADEFAKLSAKARSS